MPVTPPQSQAEWKGLTEAIAYVRVGDTLVVWRLDRLGRSLRHLIDLIADLEEKGIGFKSLQEAIDTTISGGRLIFQIFGALAVRGGAIIGHWSGGMVPLSAE